MADDAYRNMQLDGLVDNLSSMIGGMGGLLPADRLRAVSTFVAGGGSGASDPACCAAAATQCMRSVSQRSLNVPVIFSSSNQTIPAGTEIFSRLVSDAGLGAVPNVGLARDSFVFENANDNARRARLQDLVIFGVRADANVIIVDNQALVDGNIDYATLGQQLERRILDNLYLSIFHTSDEADPYMDKTNLSYFGRERFFPLPPIQWSGRDPKMALSLRVSDYGTGAQLVTGVPQVTLPLHELQASCVIKLEFLAIPPPDKCGSYWPGELCPKGNIANSKWYSGQMASAKRG